MRVHSMKSTTMSLLLTLFVCSPVIAEKPEWAGQGKPTAEQKEGHKAAMQAKKETGEEQRKAGEQMQKGKADQADKAKAMEKTQTRQMEQEQKQTGEATQAGKQTQEKKRKWWKFWGE